MILILTAFINIMKLTIPLYIFQLLDRVVASRSVDTLILLTAMTIVAVVTASSVEVFRRTMLGHWGGWIEEHLGRRLFLESFDRRRARAPGKSLDDLAVASGFVSGSALTTWLDAMWAPAFLLIVYLIHPLFGAIVFAGMCAMLVLGILNEILTRPMRAEMRKARRKSEVWISTANDNVETVAGLNISVRLADRWQISARRRRGERQMSLITSAVIGEALRFAEATQRIACYGVGVWLAIDGSLSVGGIIAGAVLGRIGTSSVRRAMANWRHLVLARRAYFRIKGRLERSRHHGSAIRDRNAMLQLSLEEITFSHTASSAPLFRRLSVEVEPGQILCVVGPSGSGKTTLARLIAGIAPPTMGRIRLGDLDITRFSPSERQRLLGYMSQNATFIDGTIGENITSLRSPDEIAIVEAARLASIHDVISKLPSGYETRLSPKHATLSGGELRRLALARALYGRPRLIVLDEPESNLDQELVQQFTDALQECRSWGSVVVVTSQLPRLAGQADKVIRLDRNSRVHLASSRDQAAHDSITDGVESQTRLQSDPPRLP